MLYKKSLFMVAITLALSACTTGRLEYVTPQGETKFACENEQPQY
ncbi:hypothetical protein GCM10011357_32090 [Lacimicrobium alkaliphilum]|uniref:Lipoprotein n=1 Tax=Lacimicrobium alkaliphilum TaxID=1526571 RepID=A0ABQ1RQ85_9ALTE|nr:hypothetical protein GCM10011357_32090 [Lacimicrobium alkaliphilum]